MKCVSHFFFCASGHLLFSGVNLKQFLQYEYLWAFWHVCELFCSLSLDNVTLVHAGNYRCGASNYGGYVMSMNMTLYVGGSWLLLFYLMISSCFLNLWIPRVSTFDSISRSIFLKFDFMPVYCSLKTWLEWLF